MRFRTGNDARPDLPCRAPLPLQRASSICRGAFGRTFGGLPPMNRSLASSADVLDRESFDLGPPYHCTKPRLQRTSAFRTPLCVRRLASRNVTAPNMCVSARHFGLPTRPNTSPRKSLLMQSSCLFSILSATASLPLVVFAPHIIAEPSEGRRFASEEIRRYSKIGVSVFKTAC